jgi:rhodanese-related sulfurtransferase
MSGKTMHFRIAGCPPGLRQGIEVNFVIDNWMLIAVALVSGGMLLWPAVQGARGGLGTHEAVQLINREKGIVVDVSEPEEFAQGHIGGARNVPLGQLEQRLPEVVKNKSLPVILVCATGGRAQRALATAKKLGYEKAQALAGGLKAWKDANLPVEKA